MNLFFDSLWRAAAYCLQPRLMLLSLVPLVLMTAATGTLFFLFWDSGVGAVQGWLSEETFLENAMRWLDTMGLEGLRMVVAPLLILLCVLPLIITLTLLLVNWCMTPAIVTLVASRRFPQLQRLQGGSWWRGMAWGAGAALLALLCLVVSSPLWLIPPLVMILPPLIGGWLTFQVLTYDVLAEHASVRERIQLKSEHRWMLLAMGVFAGFLSVTPALLVISFGVLTIVVFPVLVPVAIWMYTLVFAFSALWFAHYCLAALEAMRRVASSAPVLTFDASRENL